VEVGQDNSEVGMKKHSDASAKPRPEHLLQCSNSTTHYLSMQSVSVILSEHTKIYGEKMGTEMLKGLKKIISMLMFLK
jgi:NO-binding membrane sensor protein with MHYT domain